MRQSTEVENTRRNSTEKVPGTEIVLYSKRKALLSRMGLYSWRYRKTDAALHGGMVGLFIGALLFSPTVNNAVQDAEPRIVYRDDGVFVTSDGSVTYFTPVPPEEKETSSLK